MSEEKEARESVDFDPEITPEPIEDDGAPAGALKDLDAATRPEPDKSDDPKEGEGESDSPALSEETLKTAEDMGLDVESLDPQVVQGIVDRAERQAFNRYREMIADFQPQQGQQDPPQRQQQPPHQQQQPQQDEPPEAPPEFKLNLDPDEYGEELIKAFEGMNSQLTHYKGQLDKLNQMLEYQYEQAEQSQLQDTAAWFDGKLSDLGDESVFGKGRLEDLPVNSKEYAQRVELWNKYNDWCLYKKSDPFSKDDELLGQILRMEGMTTEPSSQQKQLSEKVKERQRKTIGRPSGRKKPVNSDDSRIDPSTGLPSHLVDETERMIQDMLSGP